MTATIRKLTFLGVKQIDAALPLWSWANWLYKLQIIDCSVPLTDL
jgi:hypothetical protein